MNCRICNGDLIEVLDLGNMAFTGRFPKPGEPVPTGRLNLGLCKGACGLIQLLERFDLNEMYGPTYGYRSGLNGSMVKHLTTLASVIAKHSNLEPNDLVIDIGASDGTFLKAMPTYTQRVGIDPSAAKFASFYPDDIELVVDFFPSAKLPSGKAKVITSIAMFYDLEAPLGFAKAVADKLAPDGIWHTEQSYLPSMLHQNAFDTICHEHLEYYALKQIDYIAKAVGLKVVGFYLNDINGGSFGITFAHEASPQSESSEFKRRLAIEATALLDRKATYTNFKAAIDQQGELLHKTLTPLDGLYGFGASTKGNVLLQYFDLKLDAIYDVNPDKDGCVTPGTNIPIVATPPNAKNYLVLPWHFRDGILAREQDFLKAGGQFIFPLPTVEVVSAE